MIMRVYGNATTLHTRDEEFDAFNPDFPPSTGARQIYDVQIDLVQTSCGYAMPFYNYAGERDVLKTWAENKRPEGIATHWEKSNQHTIDGMPTHIMGDT